MSCRMKLAMFVCLVSVFLGTAACGIVAEPGSISMSFEWGEVKPEGSVHIWLRVEERSDVSVAGSILASSGPDPYQVGEPFEATLGQVANGDNRVVVVEVREGPNAGLPVLFYGLSAPFSVKAGEHSHVEVPMTIQVPEADQMEAGVELRFPDAGKGYDEETGRVALVAVDNAVVHIRSRGAVGVVLANDASFSAGMKSVALGDPEWATCGEELEEGVDWTVCDIGPWNLLDGLPHTADGLYTVYVKLVDRNGYESQVRKASVMLDSQAPLVLTATISPRVAHSEQTVLLSVTFHEPLRDHADASLLEVSPWSETTLLFGEPERVGTSNTYVWTAYTPTLEQEDTNIYTFSVEAMDPLGNQSDLQPLADHDGEPVTFSIDALPPRLVPDLPVDLSATLFGIPGEERGEADQLSFDFVLEERSPQLMGSGEDGVCTGICPEVRLSGKKLGVVLRTPALDDPEQNRQGFTYRYDLDAVWWGAVETEVEIAIQWSDLAGNSSEQVLDLHPFFDFRRPGATSCMLTPESAAMGDVVRYEVTVSELLQEKPELVADYVSMPPLFENLPEMEDGGLTWIWERSNFISAQGGAYEVAAMLLDEAGNASQGPVCPKTGTSDGTPPQWGWSEPVINKTLFGIEAPDDPAASELTVDFAYQEKLPGDIGEFEGLCAGDQCPKVDIGGKGYGTVERNPLLDDPEEDYIGFTYRYQVMEAEWGEIDQTPDLHFRLEDEAGNVTERTIEDAVRFDFVRPDAVYCFLSPEYAGAGQDITYSVTANEPLDGLPVLYVVDWNELELFGPESGVVNGPQSFVWTQPTADLPVTEFNVEAWLVDAAGNKSAKKVCKEHGWYDPSPPALPDGPPPSYPLSFGLNDGQVPGAQDLHFDFVIREDYPLETNDEHAPCEGDCPVVAIGGQVLGEVWRQPEFDSGYHIGFRYEYNVDPEDWGAIDQEFMLSIAWSDKASNHADITLPEKVHFDFIRPEAFDCSLLPAMANAGDTISYSFSVSEPLEEVPELDLGEGCDALFPLPPTITGEGLNYAWSGSPADVADDTAELSAMLKDKRGNLSAAPVCSLSIAVDTQAPAIEVTEIFSAPEVKNSQGEQIAGAGDGDAVFVKFTATDNGSLAAADPMVQLDTTGGLVDFERTDFGPFAGGAHYIFRLHVSEVELSDLEGAWPIRITLTDEAGNSTIDNAAANQLVRLDFTPPQAECVLVPPSAATPYAIGQKITLQVFPFEELEYGSLPLLQETVEPVWWKPLLEYDEGSKYQFSRTIQEGDDERTFQLGVTLRDLVGNETPAEDTACTNGHLYGAIDGTSPSIEEVSLEPADAEPLRKDAVAMATMKIRNTDLEPQVSLGSEAMWLHKPAQATGEDTKEWVFVRKLTGMEGEGERKVEIQVQDEAGNTASNLGSEPTFQLDFTDPEAQCALNPTAAKIGDTVRLTVTFSEALDDAGPTLWCGTVGLELNEQLSDPQALLPKYVYEFDVESGDDVGTWGYAIEAHDRAGNPFAPEVLCQGEGIIDGQAIPLNNPSVYFEFPDPDQPGEWVDSGLRGRHGSRLTVEFNVPEIPAEGTLKVTFGDVEMTKYVFTEVLNRYLFTAIVDSPNASGVEIVPLTVEFADAAGNKTIEMLTLLTLDHEPPALTGQAYFGRCDNFTDARLAFNDIRVKEEYQCAFSFDPDSCESPQGPITGPVEVAFSLLEPVQTESCLVFVDGGELAVDTCASTDSYVRALYSPNGEESQEGCSQVTARVDDLAGNRVEIDLGCLRFDFQAPASPAAASEAVQLYRNPWGSVATGYQPGLQVLGCPGHDFCEPAGGAAAEGGARVRVYDTENVSQELQCGDGLMAEQLTQDDGGFTIAMTGDRPVVCLSQVDLAGNEGPAEAVKMVRWVATFNGKIPGDDFDNPHNLLQAVPFAGDMPRQGPETVIIAEESLIEAVQKRDQYNVAHANSGDGAWRQMGARDSSPSNTMETAMVLVQSRNELLQFGGQQYGSLSNDTWAWADGHWRQLCTSMACQATSPPHRSNHHLLYDPATDKVYLYAGVNEADEPFHDLWSWDGVLWREVDQGLTRPPERHLHGVAFDESRGVIVLFGGTKHPPVNSPSHDFGDTWEFDGETWTRVCLESPCTDSMPSPRYWPGMTYDSTNERVLLFGGADHDGTSTFWKHGINDFWSWDGAVWTKLCGNCIDIGVNQYGEAASGLRHPNLAWDRHRSVLVMFGGGNTHHADQHGNNDTLVMSTTFEWDGATWSKFEPETTGNNCSQEGWPCLGYSAGMSYDPERGEVVLFGGGYYGTYSDQTYRWREHGWEQYCTTEGCSDDVPVVHSAAHGFDPWRGRTVLFGDQDDGAETWEWDGREWVRKCTAPPCSDDVPPGRSGGMAAWVGPEGKVMLHGGPGLADTWGWDGDQWELLHDGTGLWELQARQEACLTYVPGQGALVFGGWAASQGPSYNNIWAWEPDADQWTQQTVNDNQFPEQRSWAACAGDAVTQRLLVFGGAVHNSSVPVPESLPAWGSLGWEDLCSEQGCLSGAPRVRTSAMMVKNLNDHRFYMFGGTVAGDRSKEFWRWGGSAWTRLCATDACQSLLPPGRDKHAMVYDSVRDRIVVHGGDDGSGALGDTWEWKVHQLRPYLISAFDLDRARTVNPNPVDPETKNLRTYKVRTRAAGLGYGANHEYLPGHRVYIGVLGDGPWAPLMETDSLSLVDSNDYNNNQGLAISPDWQCGDAEDFDPPEGPDGSTSRDYCVTATHESILHSDGKVYVMLTTRGGNQGDDYAYIEVDYLELTVDYYRTGCSSASVDGTPCDDGDPDTVGETCQSGQCTAEVFQ